MRSVYSPIAALAAGFLASGVSAAFDAASSKNLVVYWGQGYNQTALSDICDDSSIDIVNVAFVNQFPTKVGNYPATNFGMCIRASSHPKWLSDHVNSQCLR